METAPIKFNPSVLGFSLGNALAMALVAEAAYSAAPTIRNEATDTSVIITEAEDCLTVSFPGTRNFADVLKDLECLRVSRMLGGQKVGIHQGFCGAAESVIDDIAAEIAASRAQRIKPIFGAGHSKGGALIRLIAALLAQRGIAMAGIYTFGEPRSGDKLMAWFCEHQFGPVHFRLEDGLDCITRLPGWLAGNRHSGHNVLMGENGGYWVDPVLILKVLTDGWEVYQARRSGYAELLALGNDHHVGKYVSRLKLLNGITP